MAAIVQSQSPSQHSSLRKDDLKSANSNELSIPKRKSWEHRFTQESSTRSPAPLKAYLPLLQRPGLIPLGTGRPAVEYFPFHKVDFTVPQRPFVFGTDEKAVLSTTKHDVRARLCALDIATSMNYESPVGCQPLLQFFRQHVKMIHNPPYPDWECCLSIGSSSAIEMIARMFCRPGDSILLEDHSYTGSLASFRALDLNLVGIEMDSDGLIPARLNRMLEGWDSVARRSPKPFVLYMIPTGQNPTGLTQSYQRRKEIYAIAEKHDLVIVEDDPYYFLQMDSVWKQGAALGPIRSTGGGTSPVSSYLSMDTAGRVIRLDSTSKLFAPGLRCGWLTAPAQIVDRFVRHQEISTVHPCGLSQLMLYKILVEMWGHHGLLDWFNYLQTNYRRRRDVMLRACEELLPRQVCNWDIPRAGMFLWLRLEGRLHPSFDKESPSCSLGNIEELVFTAALERGVLCCKGGWFRVQDSVVTDPHLRITFAAAPEDKITEGIQKLGETLREQFQLA